MSKNKYLDLQHASIGNYKIIGKLGHGGMGDIYKAVQEPLNRVIALKVLPPQLSRDEEFAARFDIEAKAISLLEHQNVVNIFDYGEDEGYRFIAMQFIDGMDLGAYIAEHKTIPIPEIIDFTKQICRGLRYAHGRSVVHRDIKPQNILLDKNKFVRITDFGIAKIFETSGPTMVGSTVGTPEYMSPEQAQGKKIDAQSDIYSLGIVMYEMLTRKPPFIGNNAMAVAHMQVHDQPAPPSTKRKDTPKLLEMIIMKALKKDKRERYESVEDLLKDMDRVDMSEPVDPKTVRVPVSKSAPNGTKVDQRIVDRRGGYGLRRSYWGEMAKTQWPSWVAIGALATAFILHVINH